MSRRVCAFGGGMLVLSFLGACGSGSEPEMDSGIGDATPVPPELMVDQPTPPEIPWWSQETGESTLDVAAPQMTPCPEGWSEVARGSLVTCEPWVHDPLSSCAVHEARFVGDDVCTPVGDPCPAGSFPEGLPSDRPIVYVDASAAATGSGTRSDPYRSLRTAINSAPANAVVAVAAGTYDGSTTIAIENGVTVWGVCAERVEISNGVAFGSNPVILVRGDSAELRNVQVSSTARKGIVVTGLVNARLDGVVVHDTPQIGVLVSSGAQLDARELVIRNIDGVDSLQVKGDARLGLERAVIEDNVGRGLTAAENATVDARDLAIRRIAKGTTVDAHGAIVARDAARLALTRTIIEDSEVVGLGAADTTEVTLTDGVIRGMPAVDPVDGSAVNSSGATVTLERVTISDLGWDGVSCHPTGTATTTLTDVAMLDIGHRGITAIDSTVDLSRVAIVDTRQGIVASGGSVSVEDLSLERIVGEPTTNELGCGLTLTNVAATGARMRCDHTGDCCVAAMDPLTTLELSDLHVVDNLSPEGASLGTYGVLVSREAHLDLTRAVMERFEYAAVRVANDATANVADLVIRDARPDTMAEEPYGFGILVESPGFTMARARIDGARWGGFYGSGTVSISDLHVTDMGSNLADLEAGFALGYDGAEGGSLVLERARVETALQAGMVVSGGGTAVARDVEILDTAGTEGLGWFGRAIDVIEASSLEVEGGVFARGRDVGAAVTGEGSNLSLSRVAVLDTAARRCAADTCADAPAGMGVGAYGGAALAVTDFLISGSSLCGVHVADGAEVDLSRGRVTNNVIGACVQVDGYPLGRLQQDVDYTDNGTNLDATRLPVPGSDGGGPIDLPPVDDVVEL